MSDEHKQYAATAAATLEAHILGVHSAKGEAEWWAQREILRLRAENEKLRAALKPFADISGLIPEKYTDDSEWWTDIYEVSLAMPTVGDLRAAAAAIRESGYADK